MIFWKYWRCVVPYFLWGNYYNNFLYKTGIISKGMWDFHFCFLPFLLFLIFSFSSFYFLFSSFLFSFSSLIEEIVEKQPIILIIYSVSIVRSCITGCILNMRQRTSNMEQRFCRNLWFLQNSPVRYCHTRFVCWSTTTTLLV